MNAEPEQPYIADDEIDLGRLFEILWNGKWLIAAVTVLATAAGGTYAFTATPVYSGDTMLQVERERGAIAGLADLGYPEDRPTSAEVELLRSRMVVGSVVDQLDLTIRAEPEPPPIWQRLGSAFADAGNPRHIEVNRLEVADHLLGEELRLTALGNGRFEVVHIDSGRSLGEGRVGEPVELGTGGGNPEAALFVARLEGEAGDTFVLQRRLRLAAIGDVRRQMNVSERGGGRRGDSGILEVTFEHEDRAYIEQVLNALGNAYVRQNVERRSQEAQRSLEFLNEQLPQLRAQVEQAEDAFNDFRREHRALDLGEEAQALLNRYVEVDSELQRTRIEMSEQAQTYGTDHPRMQGLRTRRNELQEVRAELDEELGEIPEREQQMLRLRREMQVNTDLYTNLLNTAQELRIAQAGTVGNVRIVDDAAVQPRPVHPRKGLTLALSFVLGGMLGVGGVLGRQFFQRGIADPDALEQRLGLSVYAVIPHSNHQRRYDRRTKKSKAPMGLLARDHSQELAVESLRSLRTSLNFALLGDVGNIVSLTSPGPENGKTFLSLNLAWLVAQSGQKVLVIDADMRRGHAHKYVESRHQQREPGLSEILAGRATFDEAVCPLDGTGVDALTSGTLPPNPSELLMRPEFTQLVKEQSQNYDLVLLDSAPILAVTDGVITAAQASATFMILRANVTTEREARAAIRRLDQNGIRLTGLVVNDYDAKREAYGQYYYQYSYRSEHKQA